MSLTFSIDKDAISLVMDGGTGKTLGTSFAFLKSNWVATAKHVVLEDSGPRSKLVVASVAGPRSDAKVIFAHPFADLAVLELDSPLCRRPLFPAHHTLAGATGLVCAGYAPSRTQTGTPPVVFVNAIPSYTVETRERTGFLEELVVFDASYSEGGHSGGPILGSGGGVVGAIVENYHEGSRLIARGTGVVALIESLGFPSQRS